MRSIASSLLKSTSKTCINAVKKTLTRNGESTQACRSPLLLEVDVIPTHASLHALMEIGVTYYRRDLRFPIPLIVRRLRLLGRQRSTPSTWVSSRSGKREAGLTDTCYGRYSPALFGVANNMRGSFLSDSLIFSISNDIFEDILEI